jgi:uncharacterized membrane protein
MDLSIVSGLVALCGWGAADFIQGVAIRRIGTPLAMMLRNILTLAISVALGVVLISLDRLRAAPQDIAILTASSTLYVFGYLFYMRGFEFGKAAVVAPIASAYSIVTVSLSIILGGEVLQPLQAIAVLVMIGGVFLVSSDLSEMRTIGQQKGVREAFLTLGFLGAAFYLAGYAARSMPANESFFYSALSQSIIFLIMSIAIGARLKQLVVVPKYLFGTFGIHAILVNVAWLAYMFGTSVGNISIVAPISSMFAGLTAILAITITRERLEFSQLIGLGLVLTGVFTISL